MGEKLGQYVLNNREWRGEGERWRRCERRREVSRDVEMGGGVGGGGRDEPPVLSCQCFLCRWGRRSAKSLLSHSHRHPCITL